ncbi:MAG: PAS domain-containing protein [Novosphingobium sp.]
MRGCRVQVGICCRRPVSRSEAQIPNDQARLLAVESALADSEASFAILTDAMPQMVWSTLPDGYHDFYNSRWYEFTGVPVGSTDGEEWNGMFHPEDQERAWATWRYSLETGEPYEIEYRLRHHSGEYRWTLGRALPVRNVEGKITRWIGTCTDIHEQKQIAEHNALLSRELSHRIKNIFAIISGLINLTRRVADGPRPELAELAQRVAALGRAHEFARPHSEKSAPKSPAGTLRGLITQIVEPYQFSHIERIKVSGDDVAIDDRGATPIALVIHELATNAAKYGALLTEDGRVNVDIVRDGDAVTLNWTERNGPYLAGAPSESGFGTQLAELSVERQLGGSIKNLWKPEGLEVQIELKCSRLHR